jgi:hypothetical protein
MNTVYEAGDTVRVVDELRPGHLGIPGAPGTIIARHDTVPPMVLVQHDDCASLRVLYRLDEVGRVARGRLSRAREKARQGQLLAGLCHELLRLDSHLAGDRVLLQSLTSDEWECLSKAVADVLGDERAER